MKMYVPRFVILKEKERGLFDPFWAENHPWKVN